MTKSSSAPPDRAREDKVGAWLKAIGLLAVAVVLTAASVWLFIGWLKARAWTYSPLVGPLMLTPVPAAVAYLVGAWNLVRRGRMLSGVPRASTEAGRALARLVGGILMAAAGLVAVLSGLCTGIGLIFVLAVGQLAPLQLLALLPFTTSAGLFLAGRFIMEYGRERDLDPSVFD